MADKTIQSERIYQDCTKRARLPRHLLKHADDPAVLLHICRVGQTRIFTPYVTICLVISLPKLPFIHCVQVYCSGQPYSFASKT